ncbi:MAG: hypothetical protein EHM21_13705, partial [Chloroflexi bacterium]
MLKPGLARPVFPLWGLALILWSLTGCASPAVGKVSPMETPAAAVSTTPLSAGVAASLTESPTHLPTPSTLTLSISSDLPEGFLEQLKLPASIELAEGGSESSMALSVVNGVPAGAVKSSGWVYAVVAPFPTVQDDVRLADLENFWKGKRG